MVGFEEAELRNSMAHVAKIKNSIFKNVLYVINTAKIGVNEKKTVFRLMVSNNKLASVSIVVAEGLNIKLGIGKIHLFAGSAYASFKKKQLYYLLWL